MSAPELHGAHVDGHEGNPRAAYEAARQAVRHQVQQACARVAPNWPLDRSIAVNPWWGWTDQPLPHAGAALSVLCGAQPTMPRAWFQAQWTQGRLRREHLCAAVERQAPGAGAAAVQARVEQLVAALQEPEPPMETLPLLTAAHDDAARAQPWTELATHQLSQHCAAYFDHQQSLWRLDGREGLWASWRAQIGADRSLPWRRSRAEHRAWLEAQPADPIDAIAQGLDALALPPASRIAYLVALLMSCNGWASWCAWLGWQARLEQREDDHLVQFLAIRLAWEQLVERDADTPRAVDAWRRQWADVERRVAAAAGRQQVDWLLQEAIEVAFQAPLARALAARPGRASRPASSSPQRPALQAVFCIDVRSEPMRRALEAAGEGVQTHGFAGFFGVPLEYHPLGTAMARPQLPGLLSASLQVDEVVAEESQQTSRPLSQVLAARRRQALGRQAHWNSWRQAPLSVFGFVEACGLGSAVKLLRMSRPAEGSAPAVEQDGLGSRAADVRPRLRLLDEQPQAAAELAFKVLRAMGLGGEWASIVLLVGHGSRSANNPQAAALACGACGGQSGEVNARVLADLLNHAEVRAALVPMGVQIPQDTWFVPALHDTVTDDVRCFDLDLLPPASQPALARAQAWLADASAAVRAERAPALGLDAQRLGADGLARALKRRANDASQVRPEWGLAGNAALVVAPRTRTHGLVLEGRCFLHDYDWLADPGGQVLELIMTAPMVVAHWINLQYYASTVSPQRFGSGNKVLHNVVGGSIGVFEGNGGDLRIGLAKQSLHDGTQLRHEPLRLSVFIEAPRAMIDEVLRRHEVVRHLVQHRWLHLLRLPGAAGAVERYADGAWVPCEA